jgi:release factor glutamine methyltransferase
MLTVLEAINLSTDYLNKKGIESPRLNAEMLLADVLRCKRLDLYLAFDRPLMQNEVDSYRKSIKRRSEFEPLQYITGKVEFYGLEFKVNPCVLIPRQETEILVEAVINKVGNKDHIRILDVGTGSGNIAISIAHNLPKAKIFAIDNNDEALKVAAQNAELNSVVNKIKFLNLDIKEGFRLDEKVDCIVSNPPYISIDDYNLLSPELKDYEPSNALTDKGEGLSFYKLIANISHSLLSKNGMIFFEMAQGQYEDVKIILKDNGFNNIDIVNDFQNIERVIYGELN